MSVKSGTGKYVGRECVFRSFACITDNPCAAAGIALSFPQAVQALLFCNVEEEGAVVGLIFLLREMGGRLI